MLINCVAYENGSKLADIPIADISEYIVRPDCFVWVALADGGVGQHLRNLHCVCRYPGDATLPLRPTTSHRFAAACLPHSAPASACWR